MPSGDAPEDCIGGGQLPKDSSAEKSHVYPLLSPVFQSHEFSGVFLEKTRYTEELLGRSFTNVFTPDVDKVKFILGI